MPDLNFAITGAGVPAHAATPQLTFDLEVTAGAPEDCVQAAFVQCQIRFEAARRTYDDAERSKLRDLFGAPEDWGRALRSLLWTHVDLAIPSFTGQTAVDLPVDCTYDLRVASAKYLYGLEGGDVPLLFLFSGTVFYKGPQGQLQVQQVARTKECTYRLPVRRWKEMIESHHPNTSWLYLQKDVFERLCAYKRHKGLPTWEEAVESLLAEADVSAKMTRDSQNGTEVGQ